MIPQSWHYSDFYFRIKDTETQRLNNLFSHVAGEVTAFALVMALHRNRNNRIHLCVNTSKISMADNYMKAHSGPQILKPMQLFFLVICTFQELFKDMSKLKEIKGERERQRF